MQFVEGPSPPKNPNFGVGKLKYSTIIFLKEYTPLPLINVGKDTKFWVVIIWCKIILRMVQFVKKF